MIHSRGRFGGVEPFHDFHDGLSQPIAPTWNEHMFPDLPESEWSCAHSGAIDRKKQTVEVFC